ncbi:MAG: PilZ domain-containing protein [Candidatus Omnitrophota bacterium]
MKKPRKIKRAQKYFAINIIALDKNGNIIKFNTSKASPKFYDESGLDFSTEGIKIMCSKALPAESKIQMKLLIPDQKKLNSINATGTIKWFKQIKGKYKDFFVMGVHFGTMSKTDKEKLLKLWKKYSE